VLNGILEAIKGFAGFVWEPIPISAEIMVLRVKRFFVELNVDMTNKMRDAVNNIKDEFNKLVETFPKISEKLGIVKSELAEPIDMTEATASITSQIAGLQSDLEATGMAQFFKKLFPGEGEIQTSEEFANRLKEIWGDYGASIIAINNEVTKSNNEVTENEKDKGAAITVSGEAAEKTALEIKKMSMESAISTGQSAQSVMGAIRDVIKARFASMIAGVLESEIASKGIIGLVTGAAGAAAAMALFESLVPKFAQGGDFVTSGPQMITVGDNPGGMERVQVTPLSSPNIDGPQGSITINISAPLVDETVIDSILPAIEKAQRLNLA